MSKGIVCKCEESKKRLTDRNWAVSQWFCNHSAFNGYRRTLSDYSRVHCLSCRASWRTKAAYVGSLRDCIAGPSGWVLT